MAESSTVEGMARPITDHKLEHSDSTPQRPTVTNVYDPPIDESHPEAEANSTVDNHPAVEENGTADDTAAKGNGEVPAENTVVEQETVHQPRDMTKKTTTGPVRRLSKATINPSTKPGNTTAATAAHGTSVKKILSSGTFGSSQTKPLPAKSSTMASSTKTPLTPTARKTLSGTSTSGTATKPSAAASKPTTASSTSMSTIATRRASMAPPSTKPLSSSTSSRPPSETATKPTPSTGARQASVTSPTAAAFQPRASTGSVATRPRASVSEGVPAKKSAAPRPSMPGPKPLSSSGSRPLRVAGSTSISSLKDVKEDGHVVQALEEKYKEAALSLEINLEKVKSLETQVGSTKATIISIEADRDEKQHALEALRQSKEALEQELIAVQQRIERHNGERQLGESQLTQVKAELKAAQESAATNLHLVNTLQEQIKAAEAELAFVQKDLAASRSLHDQAAEHASSEREALLQTQAELRAIKAESETLAGTQSKALQEATKRLQDLEAEVEKSSGHSAEVSQLRVEKEETQAKLSEVEVEVLELREAAEKATDEQEKVFARLKSLEQELAIANEASAVVSEALKAREEEYNEMLEKLKESEVQLQTALESDRISQDALRAKEEEHSQKLSEIDRLNEAHKQAAAEETKRLTVELELQESKHGSQLEQLKEEHTFLLEQAFQKAKNEAASVHSQELQNLRTQSQATIDQLRQAHQVSLDEAKTSHQDALETEVKSLEKQISNLNLELKATQDDLAKAKAGLEAALALEVTLKSQLEQKDAEFAATKIPVDQSEEVARLSKELANAKDDLVNLTEAFSASKESFMQISGNHQTELEEAATGRAEEVMKLRLSHEEETRTLKTESGELISRISELEVELATVKASVEAPPSAPMARKDVNGAAGGPPVVTKEELQRMHEAHNLKIYELEASQEQIVKQLQEKLDKATQEAEDQQKQAERLQMEVNFAEQTVEENEDELKQLRDEIEHLKTQLHPSV